jgi:glycosyltransferase involved in cell wall biosynthesis
MPVYQFVTKRLLTKVAAIVAISRHARDELVLRGVPAALCSIVPVGVDPLVDKPLSRVDARYFFAQQTGLDLGNWPVLLTVGRLVARKGVAWFIEHALPSVISVYPNVKYLVIGDGPNRDLIRRVARDSGLSANVVLVGQVDERALTLAYQSCDLFVMPNISVPGDAEGFGIVALEACLAARCVVATDLEGIRDAVQNRQNGVLVTSGNASVLADAIVGLLGNNEEREVIGVRARQFVLDNFGWPRIADAYLEIFDRAMAAR